MGSPCPPCKRLRGANLELLPHVNNLLGSFFWGWEGGERGTHESLGAENTHSTLEALIFPLMGNNGGGSIFRNVNNTMFLTCVICPDNLDALSLGDAEVLVCEEDSHIL